MANNRLRTKLLSTVWQEQKKALRVNQSRGTNNNNFSLIGLIK